MYDYRYEDKSRVNFIIDMRSFYASLEIASLGLDTLTTPLVVVSKRANDGSGLVMSASPAAKEMFGLTNVMRARDLPKDPNLLIATPRMDYYIKKNAEINRIFNRYADFEQIYAYSIDESLIDMTSSWKLFDKTYREVARKIRDDVKNELGIETTIGIAPTLAMAKMALDTDAKTHEERIAEWKFEDIPDKLWPISNFDKVWSIGKQTANKLYSIGIFSMYDLAHTSPAKLKKYFGKRGETLFALAWGVDRAVIGQYEKHKDHSIGNSQVLPDDYVDDNEIKLVIREIADHVFERLQKQNLQSDLVNLGIRYSFTDPGGFTKRKKLKFATANRELLTRELFGLFDSAWDGRPVRYISISFGGLVESSFEQGDLFTDFKQMETVDAKDKVIKELHDKFGFKAVYRASSKLSGGTAIYRSGLVGGHNAKKQSDE